MTDVLACSKDWFLKAEIADDFHFEHFTIVRKPSELEDVLTGAPPETRIFFPHWSWTVPSEIVENWECIGFHTAPLPQGRGGSPIQNLIRSGYSRAPVSALRMVEELDAGPIYLQTEVSLEGNLATILQRIAKTIQGQIINIQHSEIVPVPQSGKATFFSRLSREDNRILTVDDFNEFWDKVRMVDSDDYLPAFVDLNDVRIEFFSVDKENDEVQGRFRAIRRPSKDEHTK